MNQKNEISIFQFTDNQEIRIILIDNEPWFVAKDVCVCLGLGDTSKSLERLDTDEKGTSIIRALGRDQQMLIVNESGA